MVVIDITGSDIVYDLTDDDEQHSELIISLLRLPKSIILYIFGEFLIVKNIDYIFLGNIRHIKNALFNQCVIDAFVKKNHAAFKRDNIKWGKVYKYPRKYIYKLLQDNQHLSRIFCTIFANSKERSQSISEIRIGTIISVYTVEGLLVNYIVDKIGKKSVLCVISNIITSIHVKNGDGEILSNESNIISMSYTQRWVDFDYLKQEHNVVINFQPTVFFVNYNLNLVEVTLYSKTVNFMDIPQTKTVDDYTCEFK